jgi:hypothetical protein
MSIYSLKKETLHLRLSLDFGVDFDKPIELKKDSCSFYVGDRLVTLPVINIDYDGGWLPITKEIMESKSTVIVNARKSISMIVPQEVRDAIKSKMCTVRKVTDTLFVADPEPLNNLTRTIYLEVNEKSNT